MTFDTNLTRAQFVYSRPFGQTVSQQFSMLPGEYTFEQATVAASQFRGSGPIRVLLQVDSLGRAGHVVEEMSIDSIGSTPAVYVVRSMLAPVLGDTLYWLTLVAGHTGMVVAWNWNSIGDSLQGIHSTRGSRRRGQGRSCITRTWTRRARRSAVWRGR